MGNIVAIIVQLLSGAAGGNIAGSLMKKFSLVTIGNSIMGILGGGIGGQILGALGIGAGGAGIEVGSIIGSIVGGGVGGGMLMAIIGIIRKAISKK
jgi:hypothetical protein